MSSPIQFDWIQFVLALHLDRRPYNRVWGWGRNQVESNKQQQEPIGFAMIIASGPAHSLSVRGPTARWLASWGRPGATWRLMIQNKRKGSGRAGARAEPHGLAEGWAGPGRGRGQKVHMGGDNFDQPHRTALMARAFGAGAIGWRRAPTSWLFFCFPGAGSKQVDLAARHWAWGRAPESRARARAAKSGQKSSCCYYKWSIVTRVARNGQTHSERMASRGRAGAGAG